MAADIGLLQSKGEFLARATERLGTAQSDFESEMGRVRASRKTPNPQRAAGVLLPLLFRDASPRGDAGRGAFLFQLIKRSSLVTQPGDLSCPGGMIHPVVDRLLRPLLVHAPLPILAGRALAFARGRGRRPFRITTLFLANALRETWEEIGLAPWRVRFLGPLPTYSLTRFWRTIFPLVGFVEKIVPTRLSSEVEKIVEIPLSAFYEEGNIGCFALSIPDLNKGGVPVLIRHPCLIHRGSDGAEEILWGATFHIITRFLAVVMDYRLPDWMSGPVVERTLRPDYRIERLTP